MEALDPKLWVPMIPNIKPQCSLGDTHLHTGFQKKT